jgi:hypothetical protein
VQRELLVFLAIACRKLRTQHLGLCWSVLGASQHTQPKL